MSFPPAAGRALHSRSRWAGSIWATSPTPMFPARAFKPSWSITSDRSPRRQLNQLREQLKELQDKRTAAQAARSGVAPTQRTTQTRLDRRGHEEHRRNPRQNRPSPKRDRPIRPSRKTSPSRSPLPPNAEPGERELRLAAPMALSQPLVFCVGQLPEFNKPAPSRRQPNPGANRGAKRQCPDSRSRPSNRALSCHAWSTARSCPAAWTVTASRRAKGSGWSSPSTARELMPYLADAVPGWFQAAVSLYDAQGHEVAYADHYRFHPDPVLFYEVPKDGEYVLQIRDSIYRGPRGFCLSHHGGRTAVRHRHLPAGRPGGRANHRQADRLESSRRHADPRMTRDVAPGVYPLSVRAEKFVSNHRPLCRGHVAGMSSHGRQTIRRPTAQPVTLPVIVNGRIEQPGQWDVFRFQGARRRGNRRRSHRAPAGFPAGFRAQTDRRRRQTTGLQRRLRGQGRRPANALRRFLSPRHAAGAGAYYLYLGDAQHQGGPEYAYRLRLSPPRPDFALRVVPSSLAVRGGMSVPFTVYALRRDGFSNEITLALKDAPAGFTLSGGTVPANQDQVRLTLTAPPTLAPGVLQSRRGRTRADPGTGGCPSGCPGGRHDAGLRLLASGSVAGTGGAPPGPSPVQARLENS